MKQQTAIDWLVKEFNLEEFKATIEFAKAMEKEQIKEAFISGGYAGLHFPLTKDAFYKEYLEDKFSEYHNINYTNGL